jgi:hypothetical protein
MIMPGKTNVDKTGVGYAEIYATVTTVTELAGTWTLATDTLLPLSASWTVMAWVAGLTTFR